MSKSKKPTLKDKTEKPSKPSLKASEKSAPKKKFSEEDDDDLDMDLDDDTDADFDKGFDFDDDDDDDDDDF